MKILSAIPVLFLLPTISYASPISVNFHVGNDSSNQADHELSSGEIAGLIAIDGASWNNINVGNGGATNTATPIFASTTLTDKSGADAATIAPSVNSSRFIGYAASSAANANELGLSGNHDDLFNSYLALGSGDAAALNITGLGPTYTADGYRVIIYSDSDRGSSGSSGTRTSTFTIGGTSQNVIDNQHVFSGTYTDGTNYTIFTGLTDDNFSINLVSADGGRAAISGFQILPDIDESLDSFSADDLYVSPGDSVVLSWTASDATSLSIDQGVGTVTGNSITINPTVTSTYTLTATFANIPPQQQAVTVHVGPQRPNILLFLVDDMGITDTSVPFARNASGNLVTSNFNTYYQTPNMETLASLGMKFTQAYATPVCSSTRASIFTGYNTPRHGIISQVTPSGALDPVRQAFNTISHGAPLNWKKTGMQPDDVTMSQILSDAGYRTIHSGKGHFGSTGSYAENPQTIGFDVNIAGTRRGAPASYTGSYGNDLPGLEDYENTGTFLTDAITQAINISIEESVNDGVPFFAYMSHYAVHSPFTTDPNATGDYSAGTSNSHRAFSTMIEGMDQSLGAIIAKLNDLGVAEDTLVIFLGDNGSDSPATNNNTLADGIYNDMPIRGKKATHWEGGIRVPMIVAWGAPNASNSFQSNLNIPQNSIEDDLVTVWDVLPTVLNITDIAAPHAFDGYDLSQYLQGNSGTHRPQNMLLYLPIDHNNDFFSVYRDDHWKLIYLFASDTYRLYDLSSDPTESNDLASANPERVMQMARAMAQKFDQGWGIRGVLWPRFTSDDSADALTLPNLPTVDSDNDGIPDLTEDTNQNGIVDAGETNPDNTNSDGDNVSDGDELLLGLDPLNQNSFFSLTQSTLPSGEIEITWPSSSGTSFTIYSSTDLIDWTTIVASDVSAASGNSTSYSLGIPSGPNKFYRVHLD